MIIVIAMWPLLGVLVLYLLGQFLAARGLGRLPTAEGPGEVLARMYLWPLVVWRIRKSIQQKTDQQ